MCLTFLNIIYLVAFGLMLDITIKGGAKSTLPGERAKGVTYPWNIKVQIAQTALIGVEALTLAVALVTCLIGRARIGQLQDEEQENGDYGLKSSEVRSISTYHHHGQALTMFYVRSTVSRDAASN